MIAGALRRVHEGRKLTVGSLTGVVWSTQARFRYPRGSLLNPTPPIDIYIHLLVEGKVRHIVVSPTTEVRLTYAELPNLNLVDAKEKQ